MKQEEISVSGSKNSQHAKPTHAQEPASVTVLNPSSLSRLILTNIWSTFKSYKKHFPVSKMNSAILLAFLTVDGLNLINLKMFSCSFKDEVNTPQTGTLDCVSLGKSIS